MSELLGDIRHSFQLIRRHPGHALAVLLTLAIAIGVGTVVIALVDRIVLRPLPFAGSERVVSIWQTNERMGQYHGISFPDLRDWAAASKTFDALAMARSWPFTMDTRSGTKTVDGGIATPQWFAIQSIQPQIGRFFREDEMRKGNNHVVVLTDEMWRNSFGGDRHVLDRQIRLGGKAFQIIGVLPKHASIYEYDDASLWVPLSAIEDNVDDRSWRGFTGLGRLAPGATIATAKQEMASIQQRLDKTYPDVDAGWGAGMDLLRNAVAGPVQKLLFIFLASIGVVLLIACANIANLQLAFNSWRTREFSLRYALGATAAQIARQVLIESIVLALIGGLLGLLIAHAELRVFRALAPSSIPRLEEVAIDPRIAIVTTALSIILALLFGILPARTAARSGAPSSTRATGPGTDLRTALVVAELALAFVLVTATGLMTRAFARLVDWNPGFRSEGVTVTWALAKNGTSGEAVEAFDRAAQALKAIPGVTAVGQSSAGPLFGGDEEGEIQVGPTKGTARWFDVSPDYLRALGVPLIRGRDLSDNDRSGSQPAALINEAMAKRYWQDSNPIGSRFSVMEGEGKGQQWEVVGVVANVHPFRPDEPTPPEMYAPKRQEPRLATYLVIRSSLPTAALERQATDVLKKEEPGVQLHAFHSLGDLAKKKLVTPRFNVVVVSTVSVLAFVLAAIGIYGLVSFSIVSRAREIAIRLAIGADPRRVVREIVVGGGKMLGTGLLIGVIAAVALARVLSGFLFGLSPFDPLTWLAVSLTFATVVLAACWIPASRAARIDPAASLRVE